MTDTIRDDLVKQMNDARDFPANTCGASRHAAMIAEALCKGENYPMLTEEPDHCGESIAATVAALWECRTKLAHQDDDDFHPATAGDDPIWIGSVEYITKSRSDDLVQAAVAAERERFAKLCAEVVQLFFKERAFDEEWHMHELLAAIREGGE